MNRLILLGFFLSLLLHASLFYAFTQTPDIPEKKIPQPQSLKIQFLQPQPQPQPQPQVLPKKTANPIKPVAKPKEVHKKRPAKKVKPFKKVQPEKSEPKQTVAAVKPEISNQFESLPSKTPTNNKPAPGVKKALGQRPNTGKIEQTYRQQLQQLIEKHKIYPQRAKKLGQQGVVAVAFVLRANGEIEQIEIQTSSGYRLLDVAAEKLLAKISGLLPFPPEINRLQWPFSLKIAYQLR